MIEKLRNPATKDEIPKPDRNELMKMATEAFKNVSVDNVNAFKNLFFTNALDGSEINKYSKSKWTLPDSLLLCRLLY